MEHAPTLDVHSHFEATARDYVELLKPRVMSLVVFTSWVGMFLAPGYIHPLIGTVAILCIALGAGAAGAINMWYDADIDALMKRTQNRPIPSGRIEANTALTFGVSLSLMSVLTMAVIVGLLTACLLALSILFYVLIYTAYLKRRTPQNIVIGGVAGAIPPMIGWAAVTNDVSVFPLILFMIIFMWTPSHFWALALFRREDYSNARIPMLPITHGIRSTQIHILIYSLMLVPITLLPFILGYLGNFYAFSSSLMSLVYVILSIKTLSKDYLKPAQKLFAYSIFYLFCIFLSMILDKLL
ncbi:MAG: heme o synthase [Alphaproteobacteria bacterium]|nr:heme o synthase [Alphaproteobacteria bacterium]OJV47656.1 MAG: protoheme IX farnesyltransferase [Alphaproteobacteria bacterium 43-37]